MWTTKFRYFFIFLGVWKFRKLPLRKRRIYPTLTSFSVLPFLSLPGRLTSRHSQMIFKIIALKSLQISEKSACVGVFFHKVVGPQNCNWIRKRFQSRFFPVKFAKFLRAHCFTEHLQWLLLEVSGVQPATLLKKRRLQRCFYVNFAKFLRVSFLLTEYLRKTASSVYLWILRTLSEHFFYRAPPRNCYFMYILQNFNHQIQ